MAYIRPYQNGFRAEVYKQGERRSATFVTKRLAQEWANRTELALGETQTEPASKKHSLGEAVKRYLLEVSPKKAGEKWERLRLAALLDHFGDVDLSAIGQPQIAGWRDKRLQTVTSSTVNREKTLLKHVFTVARDEWHWMTGDPFKGVVMPKENDPRTALWDWKRIKRVLRWLGYVSNEKPTTGYQQAALAFLISLHTSLRASEVLRVNHETFNAQTRVIRVRTKTMKLAQVPVTRRAVKVCRLADFTIDAAYLDVVFRRARDATLVGDYHFHDARAFCLTMMARKVDILTLSRISQHKDLKMLQIYYRESPAQIALRL